MISGDEGHKAANYMKDNRMIHKIIGFGGAFKTRRSLRHFPQHRQHFRRYLPEDGHARGAILHSQPYAFF